MPKPLEALWETQAYIKGLIWALLFGQWTWNETPDFGENPDRFQIWVWVLQL